MSVGEIASSFFLEASHAALLFYSSNSDKEGSLSLVLFAGNKIRFYIIVVCLMLIASISTDILQITEFLAYALLHLRVRQKIILSE
jgi:hypothetical protein